MYDFFDRLSEPPPVPKGARIELTSTMTNDPDPMPVGARGTVTGGNGAQLHVRWDNGRTLMLLVGEDEFRIIGRDE